MTDERKTTAIALDALYAAALVGALSLPLLYVAPLGWAAGLAVFFVGVRVNRRRETPHPRLAYSGKDQLVFSFFYIPLVALLGSGFGFALAFVLDEF